MIWFILALIVFVIALVFVLRSEIESEGKILLIGLFCVIGAPLLFALTCLLVACGSGVMPNYNKGVREGYITKLSEKGIIWKTPEGQLQVGAGEQAALQAPWEFSLDPKNTELRERVASMMGKRVRVTYEGWLILPYRLGDTNVNITNIELVKDGSSVPEKKE